MPLYEYECDNCGQRFEIIQKFSEPPVDRCPKCGAGPVHKLQSAPAFQFKGSGWYITDYARKDQGAAKTGDGSKDTSSDKKTTDKKDGAADQKDAGGEKKEASKSEKAADKSAGGSTKTDKP